MMIEKIRKNCHYKKFYARLYEKRQPAYERQIYGIKNESISKLNGVVLEIGPGIGTNLVYYNSNITWIGLEPNQYMYDLIKKKTNDLELNSHILKGEVENIPLGNDSVDNVVSSLVFCSVKDILMGIKEIKRVLKPKGRFFFFEHSTAPSSCITRIFQKLVAPLWRIVGDGCSPNRDFEQIFKKAEFSDLKYFKFELSSMNCIERYHIVGTGIN